MGFLGEGDTLTWEEAQKLADKIRKAGIVQFLNIYHGAKDRQGDVLTWGDEIEYYILEVDENKKTVRLSLRGGEILHELEKSEHDDSLPSDHELKQVLWRPEYGAFMLEATPGKPYLNDFTQILPNMRLRRKLGQTALKQGEHLITMTSYPHMGVGYFTSPPGEPKGPIALSLFNPDSMINPHRRFGTLTRNIRERRGSKVYLNIPVFKDENTTDVENATGFSPKHIPGIVRPADATPEPTAVPDAVHLDAMGFGMGCCCLQCTYQTPNIDDARYLFDQLSVFAPIMLSLTAGAPIFRGYLTEFDVRWKVISAMVDDRTPEERGLVPLTTNKFVINKSRYDSIDTFISPAAKPEYNDLDLVYDKEIYQQLIEGNVDDRLAKHLAHLFIRDPLVIYDNRIDIDNEQYSDHFENIQSTNWQTVRFKPPPPKSSLGWRVEFRSMEIQFTEFENAALTTFITLLTRLILARKLSFYIPITKSDHNLDTAHLPGSVVNNLFYWRNHVDSDASDDSYEQKTIDEILNGKERGFVGLIPLVRELVASLELDAANREFIDKVLRFVSQRASGQLITAATWIRNFVRSHPSYKRDSVVTEEINFDLIQTILKIENGELKVPELLGEFQ